MEFRLTVWEGEDTVWGSEFHGKKYNRGEELMYTIYSSLFTVKVAEQTA